MSTVTKQVLIIVKQQGLDQATTAIKGLDTTSKAATKSTNGLGSAFDKGQGNALKLRTGVTNLDKSESKAVKTTNTFTQSTDKAAKSTGGLAAKFQGNKGLIFSTVGIATAGLEAVGMFQQYQNATAKVSEAQDRLNQMQRLGITSGQDYESATRDLADAQRGAQFALRILTLSIGDLIPFTLLLINSAFKLKDTLGGAKTAVDATAQATTALGNATRGAATGGMTQIATSAGTATTGLNNMGNASKLTNTAIGGLTTTATNFDRGLTTVNTRVQDATRLIGNNSSGLTGGYYGLSTGIDNSTKMSTKFKDAFTQIGASIKNLPNTLKGVATSIGSFFTNFGTHIGKLPAAFKAAGTAVAGFGRALLGLALNPIGLAIIGVSSAVLALATDFGGVRTALNNFGVAIGNAIPQLKGILTWIGNAANGALDAVASFLGFEKGAKGAGAAAAEAAFEMDPLIIALQKYIDLGPQFQNLNKIVGLFANVRAEVVKLTDVMVAGSSQGTAGLENVRRAFEASFGSFPATSAKAKAAVQAVYNTIEVLRKGNYDAATSQKMLTIAIDAAGDALGEELNATESNIAGKQKQTQATQQVQNATMGASQELVSLSMAWARSEEAGKGATQSTDENEQALIKYMQSIGQAIPPVEEMTEYQKTLFMELKGAAPLLEQYADQLAYNADGTINWSRSIELLTQKNQEFTSQTSHDWAIITDLVAKGTEGYQHAASTVQYLMGVDKERGEAAAQILEAEREKREQNTAALSDMIDTALKGGEEVVKSEEEQMTALAKTREEIQKKAGELGILDKIQGLSIQNQQNAIKITEEQTKTENTAIMTLQKLAVARGLDISAIEQESGALVEFIATNNKVIPTIDEVNAKTGELVAARQDDIKASILETQAQNKLLDIMDQSAPVIGMTGKGLENLIKIYDDTANATSIAADEVGTWYAELKKSQAVTEQKKEKLLELADTLGIEIPDSIKGKGIPAIEEYIKQVTGLGDSAEEAADRATKAFDSLSGKASNAMQNLIEEEVLAGKAKKVEEILEGVGTSMDSLSGRQAILQILANDDDLQNKMRGIPDIINQTFGGAVPQAREKATELINEFANGIESEFGSRSGPLIDTINNLWAQIQRDYPQATGAELLDLFLQAIDQPSMIQGVSTNLGAAMPSGIQQGASTLPQVTQDKINTILQAITGKKPAVQNASQQLGAAIPQGTEQGAAPLPQTLESLLDTTSSNIAAKGPEFHSGGMTIGNEAVSGVSGAIQGGAGQISNAAQTGIRDPLVQNAELVIPGTETALAPMAGIFDQAFVDASVAATTRLNSLISLIQGDIIRIHTTAKTWLGMAATEFQTFVTNSTQHLTGLNTGISTAQGILSGFSTQVAGYMTSMTTNVSNFVTNSSRSLGGINTTAGQTGTAFKTMGTSVSSGSSVGLSGVTNFTGIAGKGLGGIIAQAGSTGKAFQSMGSQISSAMSAAGKAASNFANSFKNAMNGTINSAKQAQNAVNALQKTINSLKGKSVYVGVTGPGARFMRHGGAFISSEPTGFAQGGKSFINTKPRKIGGVNISEFGKPELVSVMPLSDPGNPMDKGISLGMPETPKLQPIPKQMSQAISRGGGGTGGQPITVTGDTHIVIMAPDGQVLSKLVQPHLLKGFSGIT